MNINNFGGTIHYNDHHKEFTINGASSNISEIVRSFFSEDIAPVENVQPEDITPVQEVKPEEKQTLPFLVIEKLAELRTYSVLEFEALYHEAVKGGAPKLAKFIKHYRELKVLDTKDLNKKETFEQLKAFFGDELNYEYPNFAAYY